MKIRDLIGAEPIWVSPYLSVSAVAELMNQSDCAFLPVLEDGRAIGVVTDHDVAFASARKGASPQSTQIREAMSRAPFSVSGHDSPAEAVRQMIAKNVRRLVVEENGRFVGTVSLADLVGFINENPAGGSLPRAADRVCSAIPGLYLG